MATDLGDHKKRRKRPATRTTKGKGRHKRFFYLLPKRRNARPGDRRDEEKGIATTRKEKKKVGQSREGTGTSRPAKIARSTIRRMRPAVELRRKKEGKPPIKSVPREKRTSLPNRGGRETTEPNAGRPGKGKTFPLLRKKKRKRASNRKTAPRETSSKKGPA